MTTYVIYEYYNPNCLDGELALGYANTLEEAKAIVRALDEIGNDDYYRVEEVVPFDPAIVKSKRAEWEPIKKRAAEWRRKLAREARKPDPPEVPLDKKIAAWLEANGLP
jgi:hypothetical protein